MSFDEYLTKEYGIRSECICTRSTFEKFHTEYEKCIKNGYKEHESGMKECAEQCITL